MKKPNSQLVKAARLFIDSSTITEYKINADLQGVSRKNYLMLFDPLIMFHWFWEFGQGIRWAIAFSVWSTAFFVVLAICASIPLAINVSGGIAIAFLVAFDIGVKIGKNAVRYVENENNMEA